MRPDLRLNDSPITIIEEDSDDDEDHFRVLVAEDNAINQKVIKRLLEKIGMANIDMVEDGVKAVEACAKRQYDLVFMDIMVTNNKFIMVTM